MSNFKIEGGRKLSGSVQVQASKNGAIGLMVASLLNEGETILHRIPKIEEVYRYIEILQSLNVKVSWIKESSLKIKIKKGGLSLQNLNKEAVNKVRSFTFVGALIHSLKNFHWPHFGGCQMGERNITAHKFGLEYFGINIQTKENFYNIQSQKLCPASSIVMYESSDTGAINLLLAAAKISGISVLKFVPPNYQVQDVCFLLEKFGVKLEGIGTSTLKVFGLSKINKKVEHYNSEDPTDAMFFMTSAIVTNSPLLIKNSPIDFLELELEKLKHMGVKFSLSELYLSQNKKTKLVDIKILARNKNQKLIALPDKIHTGPFPAINNDNLPFFVPIAALAKGMTLIHDWTWENRAIYFTELNKLGADLHLADPHRVFITGVNKLKAGKINCPPALRPAAMILVAMLAAQGTSILKNVYSIHRGYEDVAERLNKIGAKVEVFQPPAQGGQSRADQPWADKGE